MTNEDAPHTSVPGMAASAGWIVLAYRRYFSELDELSRRLQYEAIAFAFGTLMLLGTTAAAATVVPISRCTRSG